MRVSSVWWWGGVGWGGRVYRWGVGGVRVSSVWWVVGGVRDEDMPVGCGVSSKRNCNLDSFFFCRSGVRKLLVSVEL